MKKKIIISLLMLSILTIFITGTVLARPFYKDISVEKAHRLILSNGHPDLVVIDLRPASMFAAGHIPGATNIPVIEYTGGTPPILLHWNVLDAWITSDCQNYLNNKIIIHCLAGLASPEGAQMLVDAGFKKVMSMDGGFNAWIAEGYETET